MRRFYLNNRLAKLLLKSCHTITIGFFVLSKKDKLSQRVKNHETIHSAQWIEVFFVAVVLCVLIDVFFGISPLFYLLSLVFYYVWYLIEWVVKLIILRDAHKAYKSIGFEVEASENEENDTYLENRCLFRGWMKRILFVI